MPSTTGGLQSRQAGPGPLIVERGCNTRRALGTILIAAVIGATGSASQSAQKGSKCRGWLTETFFRRATVPTVAACLDAGVSPLARTPYYSGSTALHLAERFSTTPEVSEALLEAWPDVEVRDSSGSTLLHTALTARDTRGPEVIEALLAAGADVISSDGNGFTPLYGTTREAAEILLAAGTDVNARGGGDNPPLHFAEDPAMIETLLAIAITVAGIWVAARHWCWLLGNGTESRSVAVTSEGIIVAALLAMVLAIWRSTVAEKQPKVVGRSQKVSGILGSESISTAWWHLRALSDCRR